MHKILLALSLLVSVHCFAQKQLVWQLLGMTTYKIEAFDGQTRYIPNYPPVLESGFEGKEVVISGYLIPMDVAAQTYALSKNPFSSCFFCGNAGPETVIELRFDKPPGRFATDEYLMIKGTLRLNRNGTGLFFILQNAEIHG